ncbi:hypothetical protein K0P33_21080 [Pseudomonas sp. ArH3a]|uniref:hypothetical protein n=1 Tax=Pseudomonas sp. ArH3a TaxID=2862945 RepID=UPI001F590355|nr:hypothetical protein [Pseudomonas sp. ArH3a]UNM18037.1 hypothetical protein K0P33_21080 [Pseudomonas sp. ArH3a]
MIRISLLLTALLLAGCQTSPISPNDADKVSADRIYAYSGSGESQLLITRDSGFFGAACSHRIFIDGTLSALIGSGEVVTFGLKAGKHVVSIKPSAACGGGALVEREVDLPRGEMVRRRISIGPGGIDFSPTAF